MNTVLKAPHSGAPCRLQSRAARPGRVRRRARRRAHIPPRHCSRLTGPGRGRDWCWQRRRRPGRRALPRRRRLRVKPRVRQSQPQSLMSPAFRAAQQQGLV